MPPFVFVFEFVVVVVFVFAVIFVFVVVFVFVVLFEFVVVFDIVVVCVTLHTNAMYQYNVGCCNKDSAAKTGEHRQQCL